MSKTPSQDYLTEQMSILIHDLKHMNDNHELQELKPPSDMPFDSLQKLQLDPNYSNEQKKAIFNDHALSIIMAGAGSGKSHTLIGRLQYMQAQKIKLENCLILSFTNVAAQNILNRFGDINSMTITSLIQSYYQIQFPNFRPIISTNETFLARLKGSNLRNHPYLRKKYPISNIDWVIDELYSSLNLMNSKSPKHLHAGIIKTIQLLHKHLSIVMDVLYLINSITLGLQSMLLFALYSRHTQNPERYPAVKIPKAYQHVKYIMIDEAQDTSILDYLVIFNIVKQLKANLTLIGDKNQTLYEFRDADPEMFTKLKASGAFTTNKLTYNFRSNNDVLMVANYVINDFPDEQNLNIRLKNQVAPTVTKQSFHDHIHLQNYYIDSRDYQNYPLALKDKLNQDTKLQNWIIDNYKHHEQTGILGLHHKEVKIFAEWVNTLIVKHFGHTPDMLNLSKSASYNDPKLSQLIHQFIDNAYYYKINTFMKQFMRDLLLTCNKNNVYKSRFEQIKVMMQELVTQYQHHRFKSNTTGERIHYLTSLICNYEDELNSEAYKSRQNMEAEIYKTGIKNAEIILATVHASKGLEFDNTIVICDETNRHYSPRADERAYGVALTRAKKNEYLINIRTETMPNYNEKLGEYIKMPLRYPYLQCQIDLQ